MNKPAKAECFQEDSRKTVNAPTPRLKTIETGPIIAKGLCMNCVQRPRCMYFSNTTRPVMACEEFSCDEFSIPSVAAPDVIVPDVLPNPLKGLCASCENAACCMYAAAEEIRWHCEEYR